MASVTFTFQPGQPVYLALQLLPTATPEDESVAVTLPVCAPGMPGSVLELRVAMNVGEAKQLQSQLQPAISQVQARIRMMGG